MAVVFYNHDLLYYAKGVLGLIIVQIWAICVKHDIEPRSFDRFDLIVLLTPYACVATISLFAPHHRLWFAILAIHFTAVVQYVYAILNR